MATARTFDAPPSVRLAPRDVNSGPVAAAGALTVTGILFLARAVSWRQGALFTVGVAAGAVLYHAAFGFTSSWRLLIAERRGAGVRAQMLMLAVTCLVFFPVLARGELFGQAVRGSIAPLSLSVVAGAFIFGLGMQLGGGCASGTLYSAGGGSIRMLVTLAAFIAGSVIGLLHVPFWERVPAWPAVSLVARFGAGGALAVSLVLFGGVAAAALALERGRHGVAEPTFTTSRGRASLLRGPWPLVAGALGLAAVNIATLMLAGRPWGVTSAFALWGSKAVGALGVDVAAWPYWQPAARAAELRAGIISDVTSVMDLGIMVGAFGAAGLAGRFAPEWRVPGRSLVAAIAGGLMLGYGARIAYGCNIGAYFGGIASSSLHGWLWFAAAFTGNIAGTRFRPWFGLRV
jgi:uncharacterized membrane protein YedE/YeeE